MLSTTKRKLRYWIIVAVFSLVIPILLMTLPLIIAVILSLCAMGPVFASLTNLLLMYINRQRTLEEYL